MPAPKTRSAKLWGARVDANTEEFLRVALFLNGLDSMQDLLEPILREYADSISRIPEAQATLRNKDEFRARQEGKLTRLHKEPAGNGEPA